MPSLTAENLIIALKKLNTFIGSPDEAFQAKIRLAALANSWFTPEAVELALGGIREMLNEEDLHQWFSGIRIAARPQRIGLILAGNIPMVGFHDVLCVLATGNTALIKLSSSDDKLLPAVLDKLTGFEPGLRERIVYTDRLKDFDAVIATGSNNTSRYFEYYFGKVPNIIRRNRNSVAILTGEESPEEIAALGHDIFDYFGMGCRNVSKVYLPSDYDVSKLFVPLESYKGIINHFKYNNNYDYNKSIYLVNQTLHYDNGFLLLKEDQAIASPLAVVYFEYYDTLDSVISALNERRDEIQCVTGRLSGDCGLPIVNFGQSQHPRLWDYADEVNTITFLCALQD
ncbi:acyl-CoA reductase [Pedobacter sp. JY14-1]|uniref:acyl-CoA reductase n=1 Tax=Pedobacter sp. JY14-1 TaxID=3034151 RepID=UPI0023E17298|nr:acyl-CoA reductase [Pedobacter sp. JY14-1]